MEKEIRVYAVNIDDLDEDFKDAIEVIGWKGVPDWEFLNIAEEQGYAWSLQGFQDAFNNVEICTDSFYIRII